MDFNKSGRNLILYVFKLIFLGVLDSLAIWSAIILFNDTAYILFAALVIGVITINYVYLVDKAYPLRYILPGTLFMVALVVYPIFYTAYISFTNYGTGNILSKDQVIHQLENKYYQPPEAEELQFTAFKKPDQEEFAVLLEDEKGNLFLGIKGHAEKISSNDKRLKDNNNDGEIDEINGYQKLDQRKLYQNMGTLEELAFKRSDKDYLYRMASATKFKAYEPQYEYNWEKGKLINLKTEKEYYPRDGFFRSDDGEKLTPGYRTYVGWENYRKLLTDQRIFQPFLRVFLWTFQWALLSVFTTFVLGLFMAILLNDKNLILRKFYRVILILPYAIPAFISVLIWRGLFNTEVGVINAILNTLSIASVPWMESVIWSRIALVIVNLWLGFPYMMLISLGALQSIPQNLYEAAAIDGASPWQRLKNITLPLLLVSLGPLLISSFAFNFNNFNIIYLFNEGGPAIAGSQTPAGGTDILISYTYNLSFATGRGADYALASTVTLFIFMITAIITWFNFKYTGALEEVKENV
ncbi:MAG: maltose ABC transporter permease MalF [Halanaerobiales bacterium]